MVARSGTCRGCSALVDSRLANTPGRWLNIFPHEKRFAAGVFSSHLIQEPPSFRRWKVAGGEPQPWRPGFREDVVLLVRYDEKGVVGLISTGAPIPAFSGS